MTRKSNCGTVAGARAHYSRGEKVCDECRAADHQYRRAARERNGPEYDSRTKGLVVRKEMLAELYLNVDLELQQRVEQEIGIARIDAIVALFDQMEEAS